MQTMCVDQSRLTSDGDSLALLTVLVQPKVLDTLAVRSKQPLSGGLDFLPRGQVQHVLCDPQVRLAEQINRYIRIPNLETHR